MILIYLLMSEPIIVQKKPGKKNHNLAEQARYKARHDIFQQKRQTAKTNNGTSTDIKQSRQDIKMEDPSNIEKYSVVIDRNINKIVQKNLKGQQKFWSKSNSQVNRSMEYLINEMVKKPSLRDKSVGLFQLSSLMKKLNRFNNQCDVERDIDGILLPNMLEFLRQNKKKDFYIHSEIIEILNVLIALKISNNHMVRECIEQVLLSMDSKPKIISTKVAELVKTIVISDYYETMQSQLKLVLTQIRQLSQQSKNKNFASVFSQTIILLFCIRNVSEQTLRTNFNINLRKIGIEIIKAKRYLKLNNAQRKSKYINLLTIAITDNKQNTQYFLQETNLIKKLLQMFETQDAQVIKSLCTLFSKISGLKDPKKIFDFYLCKIIVKHYVKSLNFSNEAVVRNAIEGLNQIFQIGQKFKEGINNELLLQFMDYEGKQTLISALNRFGSLRQRAENILKLIQAAS